MKKFSLKISWLQKGVIQTYKEIILAVNEDKAYERFCDLLDKYNPGPYFYLCGMEEIL